MKNPRKLATTKPASVREQLIESIDKGRSAMIDIRTHSAALLDLGPSLDVILKEMEVSLSQLCQQNLFRFEPKIAARLQTMQNQILRIRSLRNQMELGAFAIDVNRLMNEAWEALP